MMSPNLLKTDVSYTCTSAVDDKNISIHITCIGVILKCVTCGEKMSHSHDEHYFPITFTGILDFFDWLVFDYCIQGNICP